MSDTTTIHVSDPIFREEVCVTRGDTTIYLVKYEDDTRYSVLDESGNRTGHSWRGDPEGIADFDSLGGILDDVEAAA